MFCQLRLWSCDPSLSNLLMSLALSHTDQRAHSEPIPPISFQVLTCLLPPGMSQFVSAHVPSSRFDGHFVSCPQIAPCQASALCTRMNSATTPMCFSFRTTLPVRIRTPVFLEWTWYHYGSTVIGDSAAVVYPLSGLAFRAGASSIAVAVTGSCLSLLSDWSLSPRCGFNSRFSPLSL